MKGHRPRSKLAAVPPACVAAILLQSHAVLAAAPAAPAAAEEPEGITFNSTAGTYSVHRTPKRTLEAVLKSLAGWQHQVLADGSTADYSAEDGILAMECSACGLTRPSAVDIAKIDLDTVVAYEAGTWHIGMRSKDGAEDFFGVLRGEIGPQPHDPSLVSSDRRTALMVLADLYDLAYLTQNPAAATPPSASAAKGTSAPAAAVAPSTPAVKPTAAPSAPASLAALAASGDVEAIQARHKGKSFPPDVAHALETAYGVRARSEMLEGNVDAALQTLSAARQSFGKSVPLRDREAHYVVIGDAYDRLRLAVKLDVAEQRGYLQQIRSLESDDANAIEQMLMRTLSNRIADQSAAGRKVIVEDLVSAGRDLFPAWADQLTRGKPGALSTAGVEIGAINPSSYK